MYTEAQEPTDWWSDREFRGQAPAYGVFTIAASLPPRSSGTAVFGATEPDPGARGLASMSEDEILSVLIYQRDAFKMLLRPLVDDSAELWAAIGLRPHDLAFASWDGRPGDIDLLLGAVVDGQPDFSLMVGVEVKVLKAKYQDRRSHGSGYGTTQAGGLLRVGCDRAALLQFVVGHQISEAATQQDLQAIGSMYGMDLAPVADATRKNTVGNLAPGVGHILALWGHPAENSPLSRNALWSYPLVRPEPRLIESPPGSLATNHHLRRSVLELWNTHAPRDNILRRCPRCQCIVPVDNGQTSCSKCARAWLPTFLPPMVQNIQPLDHK